MTALKPTALKSACGTLSATTLRHVKEFPAQTDDVFRGITLPWPRKAIKDGREIEGAESAWRKAYALNEPRRDTPTLTTMYRRDILEISTKEVTMEKQTFINQMKARGYKLEIVDNGNITETKGDITLRFVPFANHVVYIRYADGDCDSP